MCICVYVCVHACICACVCEWMYVYVYVRTCVCVHVKVWEFVCVYVCVCLRVHVWVMWLTVIGEEKKRVKDHIYPVPKNMWSPFHKCRNLQLTIQNRDQHVIRISCLLRQTFPTPMRGGASTDSYNKHLLQIIEFSVKHVLLYVKYQINGTVSVYLSHLFEERHHLHREVHPYMYCRCYQYLEMVSTREDITKIAIWAKVKNHTK